MADVVLAILRSIGNWYGSRNDDYLSPFLRHARRHDGGKRARILNDDELKRLWLACEQANNFGRFVQILLLTAQRRAAVSRMRWKDLDGDVWTIAIEPRAKSNAGTLKLPLMAMQIIALQPRMANNEYVFAAHFGNGAIVSFRDRKSALDKRSGVTGWTLHDLRRTARSLMSRAGVISEHAERVLGHVIAGVEGIYDRHSYDDEKAHALARLAALIERIIDPPEGDVVVPLRPPI
jgi:integrase